MLKTGVFSAHMNPLFLTTLHVLHAISGEADGSTLLSGQELLTLWALRLYELLDQSIRSLCVEAESISQGMKVWAFLQKILLQAISSSMKILLKRRKEILLEQEI